ncbi:MAG: hypothetical protein H6738_01005 [Alphaproteobacteria bacterium]|nr:hypothetical protein [Alphaproteobacteria bacterium]MCB9695347.1 hypothetical protein [Alphaproteobacteria bacterium]
MGEVRVGMLCGAQLPNQGEGRSNIDMVLGNHLWTAVVRHPQDALSVPGVGGATVMDLALTDGTDVAQEIVPLVGGGWLDHPDVVLLPDGIRVEGTVTPFPDRPAAAEGERRVVTWRADGSWLVAEGAEGFRVSPRGDEVLLGDGGLIQSKLVVWGNDGPVDDLGGVSYLFDTDRLLIADAAHALVALTELHGARHVAGRLANTSQIALMRRGRVLLRLPVSGDHFELDLPADVDGLRAESAGRAPGEIQPPSSSVQLRTGEAASVVLRPVWDDGLPHVLRVEEEGAATAYVPATGLRLRLGAGVHDLTLSAGPAFEPRTIRLELLPGQAPDLVVRLEPRFDPGPFVALGFDRPTDRSTTWRGSDLTAAIEAAADGLAGAVFGDGPDVPALASGAGVPRLVSWGSARVEGDGWFAAGFPWGSGGGALHGGARATDLAPVDAAAAVEGSTADRDVRVDTGWLAVTDPWDGWPQPTFVALRHPLRDDRDAYHRWLDHGIALIPTGPFTWLPVDDPTLVGPADLEQPLYGGRLAAGNGMAAWLTVEGVPPGNVVPPTEDGTYRVVVVVEGGQLDHLVLRTDVGALPIVEGTNRVPFAGRWMFLDGWSDDPDGDWVVTAPTWTRAP